MEGIKCFLFYVWIIEKIKDLLLSKAGVEGKFFFIWDVFVFFNLFIMKNLTWDRVHNFKCSLYKPQKNGCDVCWELHYTYSLHVC